MVIRQPVAEEFVDNIVERGLFFRENIFQRRKQFNSLAYSRLFKCCPWLLFLRKKAITIDL